MAELKTVRPSPKKQTHFNPPDLLRINEKDPNFTYRWICPNNHNRIVGGIDYRGWEIVRKTGDKAPMEGLFSEFSVHTLDSTIRVGDLILARMPKTKALERNEFYVEKNRVHMKALKDPKRDINQLDRSKFEGDVEISQT